MVLCGKAGRQPLHLSCLASPGGSQLPRVETAVLTPPPAHKQPSENPAKHKTKPAGRSQGRKPRPRRGPASRRLGPGYRKALLDDPQLLLRLAPLPAVGTDGKDKEAVARGRGGHQPVRLDLPASADGQAGGGVGRARALVPTCGALPALGSHGFRDRQGPHAAAPPSPLPRDYLVRQPIRAIQQPCPAPLAQASGLLLTRGSRARRPSLSRPAWPAHLPRSAACPRARAQSPR